MALMKKQQVKRGSSKKGSLVVKDNKPSGRLFSKNPLVKLDKKQPEKKHPAPAKKEPVIESIKKYFKSVINELKKVHWPGRREVVIYTIVVLVAVVLVGAMLWIFDYILSWLLGWVVG